MADNFDNYGMKVQATASVKMPTASEIDKQIRNLEKSISKLQISGKLDNSSLKNLSHQLDTLKATVTTANFSPTALSELTNQVNRALQNINIGNINVGGVGNQAQQVGQQIGQQIQNGINSSIQKGKFQQEFLFSAQDKNKVAKQAQTYFSGITNGIVSVQERMQEFEGKSSLQGFVVNIRNAKGEVESLRYSLKNIVDDTTGVVTGQMFKYTGGSINDASAIKQIQAIENTFTDYTSKLAQFKSTNTNILSGLTQPLSDFESKLAGLKNGTSTIDEVKNSFKLLGAEASKVTANFTGQLSKTDAAIRKLSQGDEIMDKLKASFNGLSNTPQNISAELSRVSNLLQEVKRIETTEGRTSNWSAKYREWSDEVDKLQAKLSVLQKQQANVGTVQELANAMADVRAKSEQARQSEEKRQQLAQNNAINKALEQEYQERQKNIEAARKQAELDKQNALAFTKSASERLSSAISKYSYGDTSDANAMMKQMNRGLSNFGNLSNIQGNITQLSSTVDKIIADLKLSHEQSLQALNQEIKAEQTLQSQKDAFNKRNLNAIDYEIQKREQEAKAFSSMLQAQMQEQQKMQANVNKIQLLSNGGIKNDYATQIAKLEGDFRSLGMVQDTINSKTQNVKNSLATLRAEFAKPVDQQNFQTIQTANDKLQKELIESRNEFEQLRASMKGMATEQQRLSLANTIEAWNQKNSAATRAVREENERYVSSLRDLSTQMTKADFNKINTSFKQTENSMRALNKLGASFTNQMKQAMSSFTTWLSASTLVMKTISETREAIANIKELDNTLTEISKTSDMTSESLEKLGMSSYDTASKYGRTSSDYLSAFESMARSGFYDEVGKGMSELSLLAQAAGDMSQEVADNYLLATNAAYKFSGDAEKLNAVLDGMNTINKMVALYGNI